MNPTFHFTHSENRVEFLEKLQRVCGQVAPGFVVQPILSNPSPRKLVVGNWSLICQKEGEVAIHNADGTKVTQMLFGKGTSCLKESTSSKHDDPLPNVFYEMLLYSWIKS